MKKLIIVLFFSLVLGKGVFAQQAAAPQPISQNTIQGMRLAFITKELKIAAEESGFWPLFYEYNDELRKARAEQKDDVIANEEKILEIRKKYRIEFKKILLTDERVQKVFVVDRDFNNLLKAELEKRNQQKKDGNK